MRKETIKRFVDKELYKDMSESGLLKAEYKEGYNQGVKDLAEDISETLIL